MKLVQIFMGRRPQRFDDMSRSCELFCKTNRFGTVMKDKQSTCVFVVIRQRQNVKQQRTSVRFCGETGVGSVISHTFPECVVHFGMFFKTEAVGQKCLCRRILVMDLHAAVNRDEPFAE